MAGPKFPGGGWLAVVVPIAFLHLHCVEDPAGIPLVEEREGSVSVALGNATPVMPRVCERVAQASVGAQLVLPPVSRRLQRKVGADDLAVGLVHLRPIAGAQSVPDQKLSELGSAESRGLCRSDLLLRDGRIAHDEARHDRNQKHPKRHHGALPC